MYFPHPVEEVSGDRYVSYRVKFEGMYEVAEPSGKSSIISAYFDMQRAKTVRKRMKENAVLYDLQLSAKGVKLMCLSTGTVDYKFSLKQITYCTQQNPYARYIFFIISDQNARELHGDKTFSTVHKCVILKHEKMSKTREIVYTFAECMQALSRMTEHSNKPEGFSALPKEHVKAQQQLVAELVQKQAVQPHLEKRSQPFHEEQSAPTPPQEHLQRFQYENEVLKERLKEISLLVPSDRLLHYMAERKIVDICEVSTPAADYSTEKKTNDGKDSISWNKDLPKGNTAGLPPPNRQSKPSITESTTQAGNATGLPPPNRQSKPSITESTIQAGNATTLPPLNGKPKLSITEFAIQADNAIVLPPPNRQSKPSIIDSTIQADIIECSDAVGLKPTNTTNIRNPFLPQTDQDFDLREFDPLYGN